MTDRAGTFQVVTIFQMLIGQNPGYSGSVFCIRHILIPDIETNPPVYKQMKIQMHMHMYMYMYMSLFGYRGIFIFLIPVMAPSDSVL